MAVENGTDRIGDRVVHVVAFNQYGVEGRDASLLELAGTLEQTRQQRKDRRRVTLRRRRLACRKPDLALRHGKARDGIHHQHDVITAITKVFGGRRGRECRANAHERRLIGRRTKIMERFRPSSPRSFSMNSRTSRPRSPIKRDDVDVRRCISRDHSQQRALADAAAAENPDPLAQPAGQQAIDGANAGLDRFANRIAIERIGRLGVQFLLFEVSGRGLPSNGRPSPSRIRPLQLLADTDGWRCGPKPGACRPAERRRFFPAASSITLPPVKPTTSTGTLPLAVGQPAHAIPPWRSDRGTRSNCRRAFRQDRTRSAGRPLQDDS